MKIFYAVQATGNGHISRAMELLPYLQLHGDVDIFLSGSNASLKAQLPVLKQNKGLSLHYNNKGKLNYLKTISRLDLNNVYHTAQELSLEKYDLILNDYEPITALACRKKNINAVHFGHQASFAYKTAPRPEHKSLIGEWVLKNFAKSHINIGLHFLPYHENILPPVIKSEFWNSTPNTEEYVCVYLPAFSDEVLIKYLSRLPHIKFEIFSKSTKEAFEFKNCTLLPVNKERFNHSLLNCKGIITNAGFETPAEALFLNKKLLVCPIGGQYEQYCNAAALKGLGVKVLSKIPKDFSEKIEAWLMREHDEQTKIDFLPTQEIVNKMFEISKKM